MTAPRRPIPHSTSSPAVDIGSRLTPKSKATTTTTTTCPPQLTGCVHLHPSPPTPPTTHPERRGSEPLVLPPSSPVLLHIDVCPGSDAHPPIKPFR
ncbi:hypothetical protein GQ607_005077 [Colletotrichum asianum]|uniref:Uncharacterized protein n=1 Tax=Colletotrichum asianum TaxID=702518 RepID=A0A8H3ZQ16_9PEZI|nr:hypothetical protein GQ607_005077 [Colletotrichum asianum]